MSGAKSIVQKIFGKVDVRSNAIMSNKAAWITEAKGKPFKVDDAPVPQPGPNDVVIRNHAVAINPIDFGIQETGIIVTEYPYILGSDAAGEVTHVGSDVKNFKPGDRVIMYTNGIDPQQKPNVSNNSFQLYCSTQESLVAKLPEHISFAQGSVLPLALSTAACGLYQEDGLKLEYPQLSPKSTGKILLVWGGSTSVGSCAIQLAKASGLEVAATASKKNTEYVKSLGATHVFDYTSPNVVEEVVTAIKGTGKESAGLFSANLDPETITKCAKIADQLGGNKFVSSVVPPGMPLPEGLPSDVKIGTIFGSTLAHNDVAPAVWSKWVGGALANGTLQCKPDPEVFGKGLESIQAACAKLQGGVSAKKIVVDLS